MNTCAQSSKTRRRLTPEARQAELIKAAGAVALEVGGLPVPLDLLSRAAGASKALIYAYFPTQQDLFNAVLAQAFADLEKAGLDAASRATSLTEAAGECARLYFEHVADKGPLIHLILRERFMVGKVDVRNRRVRDSIMLRLGRLARRELGLSAKACIALLNLVVVIPEQSGRLAWAGDMDRDRAHALMSDLVAASVLAFEPRSTALR
jgi:AcrR family transcriptional regulator